MGFWKSVSSTCSKVGTTGVFAGLATICTGLAISSFTGKDEESGASENKEVNDTASIEETVEPATKEQK